MAEGHPPAAAMAIRASYRRSRLPFARPQTLQNPPKVRPAPQGQGTQTSPTRSTPARTSHHKATAMAEGHPPAAAMASYRRSRLPFARPQTLQTLQKSAQLRREKVPQQAQHAPLPHAKATTRPQQWLKGTPRPQQWQKGPLRGVQGHSNGSRAPHGRSNGCSKAFKAAVCQASNAPNPPNPPQVRPTPQAKGTPTAGNSHHKATAMAQGHPRPQQWLLKGVQVCRLPGLKHSQPSTSPPSSAGKRYPNNPNTRHSRTQKPPQGHSNGWRAPPGRSNGYKGLL